MVAIVIPVLDALSDLREIAVTSIKEGLLTLELKGGSASLRVAEQRLLRGGVGATLGHQNGLLKGLWSQPKGPAQIKVRCRWRVP
ncbi:hypothetical protein QTI33_08375 [Variovorax sp. J22P271]|uniref:hypothetical protein n=1 Tax=Variovorax davisae TaxID=3053515 RepID=UPI00257923B7|nr:hypothetical protein [Variovorax sp. J22P271]MDM0032150.1 hypothetical protein [Variovorax sp. J22P271]